MTKNKNNIISIKNNLAHNLGQEDILMIEKTARVLLRALNLKDQYTHGHSMRVAFYSIQLGTELSLSSQGLYELEIAALFHDIGKIGVPDSVLLKPTRLDEVEFLKMKAHPENSYEILKDLPELEKIARYAKHHHERYDGRGYPSGLKGDSIPLCSRIILIADTFDAMISSRPYRRGLPYEVAFSELLEFSGSQFDPDLVQSFIKAMKRDQEKNEETFKLTILDGMFKKDAA